MANMAMSASQATPWAAIKRIVEEMHDEFLEAWNEHASR